MRYKDYNDYELLEAVLEEDEIAKQILLEKYKPLIFLVAKQYYQYALERQIEEVMLEDFTSVGEATLFTIAERYKNLPYGLGWVFPVQFICWIQKLSEHIRGFKDPSCDKEYLLCRYWRYFATECIRTYVCASAE